MQGQDTNKERFRKAIFQVMALTLLAGFVLLIATITLVQHWQLTAEAHSNFAVTNWDVPAEVQAQYDMVEAGLLPAPSPIAVNFSCETYTLNMSKMSLNDHNLVVV
jgi:hypothetical protein